MNDYTMKIRTMQGNRRHNANANTMFGTRNIWILTAATGERRIRRLYAICEVERRSHGDSFHTSAFIARKTFWA